MLLDAKGLDTVADVFLNDVLVLQSKNQFVPHLTRLKSWNIGNNTLMIKFKSPIDYALHMSKAYQVIIEYYELDLSTIIKLCI